MTKKHKNRGGRRLVYKAEVLERTGLSYPTIWDLMRRGLFPRSHKAGLQKVAWFDDEFDNWLDDLPVQPLKGDAEVQP